jgi:hypothetical protein
LDAAQDNFCKYLCGGTGAEVPGFAVSESLGHFVANGFHKIHKIEYPVEHMKLSRVWFLLGLSLMVRSAFGQDTSAAQSVQNAAQTAPAPVSYASVSEVSAVLAQLNQASQTLTADLTKVRIEKWKADGDTKRQSLANVESIQRNLQNALPAMVTQLSGAPDSLTATFKLYRNVGALHDVLSNLAESAGAFGSKDDFQALANDTGSIDTARRALADRMDHLAAAKETELANLHTQLKALQAATPPEPPKKIIVDDNPAPKKLVKKKTVPKPPAKPTTGAPNTAAPKTQ